MPEVPLSPTPTRMAYATLRVIRVIPETGLEPTMAMAVASACRLKAMSASRSTAIPTSSSWMPSITGNSHLTRATCFTSMLITVAWAMAHAVLRPSKSISFRTSQWHSRSVSRLCKTWSCKSILLLINIIHGRNRMISATSVDYYFMLSTMESTMLSTVLPCFPQLST